MDQNNLGLRHIKVSYMEDLQDSSAGNILQTDEGLLHRYLQESSCRARTHSLHRGLGAPEPTHCYGTLNLSAVSLASPSLSTRLAQQFWLEMSHILCLLARVGGYLPCDLPVLVLHHGLLVTHTAGSLSFIRLAV